MTSQPLLTMEVRLETDIVLARQRARQIAAQLGFTHLDQTRIATATSEIARNAFQYAGGGRVEFLAQAGPPVGLVIRVHERGPGIRDLQSILAGHYVSETGLGVGISGARRLMDQFSIETKGGAGACVTMAKVLPHRVGGLTPRDLAAISAELVRENPRGLLDEIQQQNRELLETLQELRERQAEIAQMHSRELDETNRGVVALYAELDENALALKRLSDLKSRYLSEMSHELRSPLNSIRSLTGFLLDRGDGDLNSEQETQVRLIRKAAEDLVGLVDDLLDLARVEAGKAVVRATWFDLGSILVDLRGMIRPILKHPAVSLVVEPSAEMPRLYSDEAKLARILRNFLSNAAKFTERGEIRVKAELVPGDRVRIVVSDTGIGIAAEDLPRIFDEFGQIESPLQRTVKGTGLGLPLARKLAEVLGGNVTVQSQPGAGSEFAVTLPRVYRAADDDLPAADPATPVRHDPAPLTANPTHVLIVDDSEEARYTLKNLLQSLGPFLVEEATRGEEALRRARSGRFELIVLDLGLPDMSGFRVLELLRDDGACGRIPVIIHTSRPLDDEERASLTQRGATVFDKSDSFGDGARMILRDCLDRLHFGRPPDTGTEPSDDRSTRDEDPAGR